MSENISSAHSDVALARQPIVNSHLSVIAYELLYRKHSGSQSADVMDDVGATAQVISASLFEFNMEEVVGSKKAFINFPRTYLLSAGGMPVNKDNVVIEVSEHAGYDPVLLSSLRNWVKAGCCIALDDFVFDAKLTPFVELADYVKLDLSKLGQEGLHKQIEALRGFDVKIVAEKVESWKDYEYCRLLGVEYFQGYFFEKPEIISSKTTKVNSMNLLQLMSSLLDATSLTVEELEKIVSQDAGLVHKLLRYLNSPSTGLVASVDSIRLAIMLIGVEKLKALTNILLMSEMVGDRHVLLEQIMLRAKHAELFAELRNYKNQDKYFLAGMLSMVDVSTGMPLNEALEELPLPEEFINAIIQRSGRVGNALDLVEHYSNGRVVQDPKDLSDLKETYVHALEWANNFLSGV